MTQVYRRLNRTGRRKFVNGGDPSSAYDAIIGEAPTWTSLKRPGINNTGWSPKAGGTASAGNTAGVVGGVAALGTGLIDAIDTPSNYGNPSTVATTGTGALGGAAAGAAAGSVLPGIGTAVGAVVGGVVGGVSGWLRGKKLRRKEAEMFRQSNEARRKYDEAVSSAIMQDPGLVQGYKGATYFKGGGKMVPVGNYAFGGPADQGLTTKLKRPVLSEKYMTGGYAKPLNSNATELVGNSHDQGGIQIPSMNAEVEGGETTTGDFVFSKELGFAKLHRPIARAIGKIEKKPQTPDRVNALNLLRAKEQRLANAQEQYKMEQGIV